MKSNIARAVINTTVITSYSIHYTKLYEFSQLGCHNQLVGTHYFWHSEDMEFSALLNSYPGSYIVQSFYHSVIAAAVVEIAIKAWVV